MDKFKELIQCTKNLLQRVKSDAVLITSLRERVKELESKSNLTPDQEKDISQLLLETKELLTNID